MGFYFPNNQVNSYGFKPICFLFFLAMCSFECNLQSKSPTTLHQTELLPARCSPYISVPDTRTAFTFCCSFNWKPKTYRICALSITTSATDSGELLISRPGRFIPAAVQYMISRGCVRASERICTFQNSLALNEIRRQERPVHSRVRRPTVFFKKTQVEKFGNLLTNGCCDHSCCFVYTSLTVWALCILFHYACVSVRSE